MTPGIAAVRSGSLFVQAVAGVGLRELAIGAGDDDLSVEGALVGSPTDWLGGDWDCGGAKARAAMPRPRTAATNAAEAGNTNRRTMRELLERGTRKVKGPRFVKCETAT
jgi:hypothetical protein